MMKHLLATAVVIAATSLTSSALAVCGDGVVDAAEDEECDDSGESATCDDDCTAAECGDATLNATAGEQCDEGGATLKCTANCTAPVCGDGIIDEGEQCDDGNSAAGDSCSPSCTFVYSVPPPEDEDEGGCECGVPAGRTGGSGVVAILLAGLAVARRRRQPN